MGANDYLQPQKSYAGFGVQTVFGTSVAATKFQTINSIGLKEMNPGRETLQAGFRKGIVAPVIGVSGRKMTEGPLPGFMIPDEAYQTFIWAAALGNNNTVSGDATNGYTHVLNEPTQASHFPGYISGSPGSAGMTIEALKAGESTAVMHDFISQFLQSIELNVSEGGPVLVTPQFTGRSEAIGGSIGSPSYTDLASASVFQDFHADLKIIDNATGIASVASIEFETATFSLNNNVEIVQAKNSGGQYPVGRKYPAPWVYNLSWVFSMKEDYTQYNYIQSDTLLAAELILTHTALAGSSSGAYSWKVQLPRLRVLGDPHDIPETGNVPLTVNCQAEYDATAGYACKITTVDSVSGTIAV
jgi:hypothetical protein